MLETAQTTLEALSPERRPPPRTRAKRWRVRESLREMIVDGRIPPGTRLVQQELASQLGTAVSVVRELLFELANMGLVEMEENHGFIVGSLDMQRLTDTYLIRSIHEGLAARLCCEKASRQDFRRLRAMAGKIVALHESGGEHQRREAATLDRQLHAELIRIADSDPLSRAWRTHWIPMISVKKGVPNQQYERSYQEHLALIEAIEQDRPDEAERLARTHILDGLERLKARIEAGEAEMQWLA
jgi:DNA-binding GntR family transcriptional regulator